jgi:hypothetical protein
MQLKGRIRQIARRQAALGLACARGEVVDLARLNIEELNRLKCLRSLALAGASSGRPDWSVLSSLELDEIKKIHQSARQK